MAFRRRSEKTATDRDATRLIAEFGDEALVAAGDMAWREDAGLISGFSRGHWVRVQQEVMRRLPKPSRPPSAAIVAPDRRLQEHLAGLQ